MVSSVNTLFACRRSRKGQAHPPIVPHLTCRARLPLIALWARMPPASPVLKRTVSSGVSAQCPLKSPQNNTRDKMRELVAGTSRQYRHSCLIDPRTNKWFMKWDVAGGIA